MATTNIDLQAQFDAVGGHEVFSDGVIIVAKDLGKDVQPVQGYFTDVRDLNLPKGTTRPDGKTTWEAATFVLTAPTNAEKDGKVIQIDAGRMVYIAYNKGLSDKIASFLQSDKVSELFLIPNGEVKVGQGTMPLWRVKFTGKTADRTQYGPSQYLAKKLLAAQAAAPQLNGTAQSAQLPA